MDQRKEQKNVKTNKLCVYEIAGFSVSVSVSGTYYARKLMTVDSTKNF